MPETPVNVFICMPRCSAGGKPEDDGHIFDIPFEDEENCSSGYSCRRCGMTNIDFYMWHGP